MAIKKPDQEAIKSPVPERPAPPTKKGRDAASLRMVGLFRREIHIGPLPPPRMLAEYNRLHPGLADRIVHMAETEQGHAHRQARFLGWTERLGLLSAVVVAFGIMGTIAYCAVNGHPSVATWLGGGFFSSVVIAFITGRVLGRQENGQTPTSSR